MIDWFDLFAVQRTLKSLLQHHSLKASILWCSAFFMVQLSATPWAIAFQAPPSMGFSRQEYWSGLPFPSPGDLPDPLIKPVSLALQEDSLPLSHEGFPTGRSIGGLFAL